MGGRHAADQLRRAGERRLQQLAEEWTPPRPVSAVDDRVASWGAEPRTRWPRWPRWSAATLRGLVVLLAIAIVIVGYAVWMGRPRAVTQAPLVLATGAAVSGEVPSASASAPRASDGSDSASIEPEPTPAPLVVVHVIGKVRRPGLVELPAGSRVDDALRAAGGATTRAATDSVNLARLLVDGEQLVVAVPARAGADGATGAVGAAPGNPISPIVNVNAATAAELDALPGVGPVIAARIIAWRAANGAFRSVDELGEVSGIGDSILSQIRALVRV